MSSAASVYCTIVSYLMELPLFATIWLAIMSAIFIGYMVAYTKLKQMELGHAFVLIPTLVIDNYEKSTGIAWLKWGVEIVEKD